MFRAVIAFDRAPKHALDCSVCGQPIGTGYARCLSTRIMYCSFGCYAADEAVAELVMDSFRVAQLPAVVGR